MADNIIAYDQGVFFILRIFKFWLTNPALRWVNNYELVSTQAGGLPELIAAANKVYTLERLCHLQVTAFDRFSIGTWTPDSVPYNPNAFVTYGINTIGQRAGSGDAAPAETAVMIRKGMQTGRQGRAFWRGCLVEPDLAASGGLPVFATSLFANTFIQAKTTSAIAGMFLGGADPIHLCSLTRTGDYFREVTDMNVDRVLNVNMNHRYYDQGGPGPMTSIFSSNQGNVFGEAPYEPAQDEWPEEPELP